MDRPSRISGPLAPGRLKDPDPAARRLPRPWRLAVVASLACHILLAALLLRFVRSTHVDPADNPLGTVELLMVEKQGSGPPTPSAQPSVPADSQPPQTPSAATEVEKPAATASSQSEQAASAPTEPPLATDQSGETLPPPAQTGPNQPDAATEQAPAPAPPRTAMTQPTETSPPPPRQQAPVFNLEGTDSDSNAIVMGNQVIPASPDNRFRNRPPVYPYDAVLRRQHGEVVLVIHVSRDGVSTGADVAVPSGVASLDRAALDAVRKWRFRPAMKNGRAVPFDMPMRFIFESQ